MDKLKIVKRVLKASVTKLKDNLEIEREVNFGSDKAKITLFKSKVSDLERKFNDVFDKIFETCQEDEVEIFLLESQEIQDNIDKMNLIILRADVSEFPVESSTKVGATHETLNVKLPEFHIPSFSGSSIVEWLSFNDLFWASIGQSKQISQAQKLQYLRGSLKGDALRIIQSLPVTDANFEIAWNLLKERYSNRREIVFALLKRFMSMTQLSSENAHRLLNIVDSTKEVILSLKSLEIEVDKFSESIFVFVILQKLDSSTRAWFERSLKDDSLPSLNDLLSFLTLHSRTLQQNKVQVIRNPMQKVSTFASQVKDQCIFCAGNHYVYGCSEFKGLTVQKRLDFVRSQGLCFNCFSKHRASACKSKYKCRKCNKNHNTLLHFEKSQPSNAATSLSAEANAFIPQVNTESKTQTTPNESEAVWSNVSSCLSHVGVPKQVLLCTALIRVLDSSNNFQTVRALLDPGSQASFISEACFNRLGLSRKRARVQISCLGSSDAHTNGITNISFTPHFNANPVFSTSVFVINKIICELPHSSIDPIYAEQFSDLTLADPTFFKTAPIDILLGAVISLPMMKGEIINHGEEEPFAVRSKLGWIISGNANVTSKSSATIHVNNIQVDTDELVSNFWKMDSVPTANLLTKAEQACEEHFVSNHVRDESGRYIVKLPFHSSPDQLGDSRQSAIHRFQALEKTLASKPEIYNRYREFMKEYEELGHMERVLDSDVQEKSIFYLPHHAVFKETSTTTKLRVVFDASARSSSGLSLNDILMIGPRIQKEIFSILLRFRTFRVAVCADVEKMFRQIKIHPDDTDFQRIIWRNHPNEPINVFRLTTVTYGTACAPFLSSRVMKQLALDEREHFPLASTACLRDFYVDDLLSGAGSEEEAVELVNQMSRMMVRGGFPLRKWISNCPSVLQDIPKESRAVNHSLDIDVETPIKVLGITWHPSSDSFQFSVSVLEDGVLTKRRILSEIARIFDPLGWLAPTVILAKIFLQELWSYNLKWDDKINEGLEKRWKEFQSQLPLLTAFKIPRYVLSPHPENIQLHAFCDASEKAYCAVIYLRSVNPNQSVNVSLLTSKTRVAPLKSQSLPRLELCSALLLASLLEAVLTTLEVPLSRTFAWSDSKVTLAWIASEPRRWLPFVANRVARIQEALPGVKWNYVHGVENAADCATRGLLPADFINCDLWTHGPQFLRQPFEQKVDEETPLIFPFDESHLRELKKGYIAATVHIQMDPIIFRFSSFTKLCRVWAWCKRFLINCSKQASERYVGHLTCDELSRATLSIVRNVQQSEFSEELHRLKSGEPLRSSSKILSLSPFIDSDGIMRVGGRLRNANFSQDAKHPIVIPKKHHLTTLIIHHFHIIHLHAAPQLLLSVIRQKFWIPCGRDVVRRFVKSCTICVRHSASIMSQMMGDLPTSRVTPSKPFSKSGVDFAGPFLIKERNGRGKKTFKVYIAIFVCFATRAIHLEVVGDLTTQAFIASLKRFIARRGKPVELISDCATNFVGADRELRAILRTLLTPKNNNNVFNFSSSEGIKWSFNPPAAPHFGGLWEAGVKSMKYHLRRTMGNSLLTMEEIFTLTVQIEACLNSRPLCPLSADPNDLSPLTPGHFLIGSALTALPEPELSSLSLSSLGRWQLVQRLLQQFWKRWSNEFLARLQERPKWCVPRTNITVGELVLIKNELLPPLKWKLARVVRVHPGRDHRVRVVTLKTASGLLKRPINKLCQLPVDC